MENNRLFFNIKQQVFLVDFENNKGWINGKCYFVSIFYTSTLLKGWRYDSKTNGPCYHDNLNDDCRVAFTFTFVFRGVYDGRLWFSNDEYCSEEFEDMICVWRQIQSKLKKYK